MTYKRAFTTNNDNTSITDTFRHGKRLIRMQMTDHGFVWTSLHSVQGVYLWKWFFRQIVCGTSTRTHFFVLKLTFPLLPHLHTVTILLGGTETARVRFENAESLKWAESEISETAAHATIFGSWLGLISPDVAFTDSPHSSHSYLFFVRKEMARTTRRWM